MSVPEPGPSQWESNNMSPEECAKRFWAAYVDARDSPHADWDQLPQDIRESYIHAMRMLFTERSIYIFARIDPMIPQLLNDIEDALLRNGNDQGAIVQARVALHEYIYTNYQPKKLMME